MLDAKPSLPQAAERLDNQLPLYSNEILISVERLNIDSASFVQMEGETGKSAQKVATILLENCRARGKQQNRVTGSGGMLLGTVRQVGSEYRGKTKIKVGQKVASLVSLSLTPLRLDAVHRVNLTTHQVDVSGHAILFENTLAAEMPSDLPENVSLAVFDVAGAPALVNHYAKAGQTVVLIGAGGKAGLLSCFAARRRIGRTGRLLAVEPSNPAAEAVRDLRVADEVFEIDATDPMRVEASVAAATRGKMAHLVINVASVPGTELGSILAARSRGKVVFFSMATSFTRVALGAEGVVSDAELLFGNGYFPGHSDFAIRLIRKTRPLLELFQKRYK